MPHIIVSEWTKRELEELKKKEEHQTFDSVVRSMILRLEHEGKAN